MNAAQYLIEVRRTLSPHNTETTTRLGLRGETGEVCDLIKKFTGHRVPEDPAKVLKELGDCAWYGAARLIEFADFTESERADLITATTKFPVLISEDELTTAAEHLQDVAIRMGYDRNQFDLCDHATLYFTLIKALAHRFGFTVVDVLAANVSKLRARYPEGFTTAASVAKADEKIPAFIPPGYDANGSPV